METLEISMSIPDRPYAHFPWSPSEIEELADEERKLIVTQLQDVRRKLSEKQ